VELMELSPLVYIAGEWHKMSRMLGLSSFAQTL
jgi:hypothetical protein